MFGKPLLIVNKDNLILRTPDHFLEKIVYFAAANVLFLFAFIFITLPSEGNAIIWQYKLFACFMAFLFIIELFFLFIIQNRFIFDLNLKKVYKENIYFFIPFKSLICDFSDISSLRIRYTVESDESIKASDLFKNFKKGGRTARNLYTYYLEFAINNQSTEFIELTNTSGKYFNLNYDDIKEIGKTLKEAIGCDLKTILN